MIILFSLTPSSNKDIIHSKIIKTSFLDVDIDYSFYDYIVVTSKTSIDFLIQKNIKNVKLLAISSPTAGHAIKNSFEVKMISDGYGENFAQDIDQKFKNKKLLFLRPKKVATNLKTLIKNSKLDEVVVYETVCNEDKNLKHIDEKDILIFTSPSSVECFFKKYNIKTTQKIIAIGKTTKKAFDQKYTVLLPQKPSIDSCIDLAYLENFK